MSSIPGITFNTRNNRVPQGVVPGRAILVIGHSSTYGDALSTPSNVSVTEVGTHSGTTTYGYQVTAVSPSGETDANAEVQTGGGSADTLDETNYIEITWDAVDNATAYRIYRITGGSNQGFIGEISADAGEYIRDTGLTASSPSSPPSSNETTEQFWKSGSDGDVIEHTSFADFVDTLNGPLATSDWNAGIEGDSGSSTDAIAPYDGSDNLLRALSLIYAANPNAHVYACPLDGVNDPLTDTTTLPSGAQRALDHMLLYPDIEFLVLANIDPVSAGVSHVEAAASSDNPYNSPRFYVTGIDLYSVFDDNDGRSSPLSRSDLALFKEASSEGLTISYIGNHITSFTPMFDASTSDIDKWTDNGVEIGGQLVAAYLAGVLSSRQSNFPVTEFPMGLGPTTYKGRTRIFNVSEMENAITEGFILTRFVQNSFRLIKGITTTSDPSWDLYPHRAVTNFIHKSLSGTVRSYIGDLITSSTIGGAQKAAESVLADAVTRRFISDYTISVRQHPTVDDAIRIQATITTVKPLNKIYIDLTVN